MRLLFAIALAAAFARAEHYSILPTDANRLDLRVYKTGLYKGKVHVLRVTNYRGTLDFDPAKPESSGVSLNLDALSLTLMDTWLSAKDFKSVQEYALKDMLDAKKFPQITFASSQVRPIDASNLEVRGTLTIRGIAKPSILIVTQRPGPIFDGKTRIKLTDYGLKPPTAALGLIGTQDEMDFTFTVAPGPL